MKRFQFSIVYPIVFGIAVLEFHGPLRGADTSLVRESEALSPGDEAKALKVPDGFEIRLFASEPMINKPINLAHDSKGRLWVSSTVEYPYAAEKERWENAEGSRVRDSRDAIKILEDTDGDGTADKVTDFADGLNIPTGVVPWHKAEHKDGCIAWSIPNIWYLADTTGDGKCDLREVLFGPLGYEKDTHGMCSSFRFRDGWVYATHGFNNTSRLEAKDGSILEMNSGNVFRFRPDGSHVEIWSRGQVNPFGLCFDGRGNLYSADCHSAPVYQLLRGATYPSFGKPHDGLGFAPAMIKHTHGSTGICGISYIDGGIWGEEWNDHVLIGNPVTSRVNLDRIDFVGTTPNAVEKPDFIVSDDPWFRPVDLCLGNDGALYVADFYNRIIGHYEVPLTHPGRDRERGRIWKIVRVGGAKPEAAAGAKGEEKLAVEALGDPSPFVRRRAAEQFQAEPKVGAVAPLLAALAEVPVGDTHLRHVLRLAIREHLKLPGAFGAVGAANREGIVDICLAVPSPEAASFLVRMLELGTTIENPALVHIGRNGKPEDLERVIALERGRDGRGSLRQVARLDALVRGLEERGVVVPDPELVAWGQELARKLLDDDGGAAPRWMPVPHPDNPRSESPWTRQPRKCEDGKEVEVLSSLRRGDRKPEQRVGVLRSRTFKAPEVFGFWICGHRGRPDAEAHDRNRVVLVDAESGEELMAAFPPRSDVCVPVQWDLADYVGRPVRFEIIDGDQGGAYAWLGVARFDSDALKVSEFEEQGSRHSALQQLATLLKVTAPADLRDRLKVYLPPAPARAPGAVTPEDRKRIDALVRERVAAFEREPGDEGKGAKVFETHCAICHQIGGAGGLVGPQLDGIGARGALRLSEDILDPNRNVDAHFYLTVITMKDGTVVAGLVRGESGEVLVLTDIGGVSHRVSKSKVAKRAVMEASVMPPGLGERISDGEFRDLLSYLMGQKG